MEKHFVSFVVGQQMRLNGNHLLKHGRTSECSQNNDGKA